MYSFTYGSRVIENEQRTRLQRNVRRIGNLLYAVVNFCLTFFLFVAINLLLRNIVEHTQLTFVKLLDTLPEYGQLLFSNSVSVVSFINHHSLCIVLAFAFTCVYHFEFVLRAFAGGNCVCALQHSTVRQERQQSYKQTEYRAISYRYKVCFLS